MSASERRACARPELSMSYDRDGRFQLRYSAPATVGALVEQALKEAKDALFLTRRDADGDWTGARGRAHRGPSPPRHAEDDPGRPTYADALEELANRSLASVTSTSRASHYRVHLHLSTDGAWVDGGHAIPLRLLGRFISDGVAQPVWETDGRPVSVGRAMRILPAPVPAADRGPRPRLPVPRLHHHPLRRDPPPPRVGRRRPHRRRQPGQPLPRPPRRPRPRRLHPHRRPHPTRRPRRPNRHGTPIRPPTPADTAPPPGGDPPIPPDTYRPPTGEPARWHDIELPPDTDLPPDSWHPAPALALVPDPTPSWDEPDDDGLVVDSYRRR